MKLSTLSLAAVAAGLLALAQPAAAGPVMPGVPAGPQLAIPVAEGCGWGRWRGPWGGCRGPGDGPAGYDGYGPRPGWYGGNGCPPGWWRGPWGHCRDTPYHGRLPDGGWR